MTIRHSKHRSALSMVEVIFVIIILGIVASIGSQIIVQVYESYISQRAIHRSSVKTELAATQLANRLAYSIPNTVIGRKIDGTDTFQAVEDIPIGTTDYKTLEWIAFDADSFGAVTATTIPDGRKPVWSGYSDVTNSSINSLSTPGSRLSKLSGIIDVLAPSSKTIANTAILFPKTYTAGTVGFTGNLAGIASNNSNIHPVNTNVGDETLTLDASTNLGGIARRTIKEHYKLAWTAYAVVPVPLTSAQKIDRGFEDADELDDLVLYYDYQPWDGNSFSDGSSVVLIRNVSVFKFTGSGDTIRFKICQREAVGEIFTTTICKEKAVIR